MKFGKQILASQVPGWSAYYLDYKGLKKIVSSLTKRKLATNAALSPSLAQESMAAARPAHMRRAPATSSPLAQPTLWESSAEASLAQPPLPAMLTSAHDGDRGPVFQEHKSAFFVKLERELEKINAFYLQKEAELRLRLENLLRKRQAAAERLVVNGQEDGALDYVEWRAVEEGFQLLERDLGKLQQFIEMNATGFRKILKKWDKRSKSTTKELYLSRQVEVMPCFNRQLISEMTDTVASCLLDVSTVPESSASGAGAAHDNLDRAQHMSAFNDLEDSFGRAIKARDEGEIRELLARAGNLAAQPGGQMHVTRIVWRAIIVAPVPLADLMLASNDIPFDFGFVDDINGRTCLHEAAIAGELRLVQICLGHGVQVDRADAYSRTALHYAAMKGHAAICRALLEYNGPRGVIDPSALDSDNHSPFIYACIHGSSECVAALLSDRRVSLEPPPTASDLRPLALAAKYGHVKIVSLLLDHGARDVPNSNGEYAIHLAARNGHAAVCELLLQHDTCDRADKYNEWTPLFHAAEQGHLECVQVLLRAGCNPNAVDENERTAAYYAAWNGHIPCVSALLVGARNAKPRVVPAHVSPSGASNQDGSEDMDTIPSLSLPPPIMPLRAYGHTYLNKAHLVVVALAHPFTGGASEPLRLKPRVFAQTDRFSHNTPSLRLVVSTKPDSYAAPFEVSLPLAGEKGVLAFQVPALDQLSLEFSLYPSFGSKTLGRAVALPCMFADIGSMTPCVLPMLDHRLHVIGEISFDVFTISPFAGPTLSVDSGGSGTYWRSSTLQSSTPAPSIPPRNAGSAHTSPSNRSATGSDSQRSVTASSLAGEFLHGVVQLTRDGVPVLCRQQTLPDPNYTLGVADVTLAQFQALSARLGRNVLKKGQASTAAEWQSVLKDSLIPLSNLGETLPPLIGLCLELVSSFTPDRGRHRNTTDTNHFVDSVLQAVYNISSRQDDSARRKFALFSFLPDICAALNWKQPNYPVFFASECGVQDSRRDTPSFHRGHQDRRCTSLGAAIDFSKANNLLGILVPANLLADITSLSSGVKSNGLMLATFGSSEIPTATAVVDASLGGGILTIREHKLSGLI